jgi:hypothetical protein
VDLPGIHDLGASSEDEAIVRRFLEQTPPDLALVVINASQITTQLALALQVQALGIPMLLALNMSDEARRFGIRIDARELGRRLGMPVVAINARASEGLDTLLEAIHRPVAPATGSQARGPRGRRNSDPSIDAWPRCWMAAWNCRSDSAPAPAAASTGCCSIPWWAPAVPGDRAGDVPGHLCGGGQPAGDARRGV